MNLRDSLFWALYKLFGQFNFINSLTRHFYLSILIPSLTYFIKKQYVGVLEIVPRHSLLEPENFNAFLSDIDLTIVIENNYNPSPLINSFIQIKKIFIMLDLPEVYTKDEFLRLKYIKKHPHWNIINTFWNIRKINWNLKSLKHNPSRLNIVKKERSNQKSFFAITGTSGFKTELHLSDLIYLKDFSTSSSTEELCFYSSFLETERDVGLRILLNADEFYSLNYLMPDQKIAIAHEELKKLIMEYESLITIASIRIDEAKDLDTKIKKDWLKQLIN